MSVCRVVRTWGLALMLAATWESAGAADWPQYRADAARSGYTAESLATELHLQWSYKSLHTPMPAWPDPGWERNRLTFDFANHVVAADGRVFFGSSADCAVRALDTRTSRLQWKFLTGGPVRFAPAVWRNRLLVASDDGHLYCLTAEGGELVWKFYGGFRREFILGNGRIVSRWPARGGPVVVDDVVYFSAGIFPTQGALLYALAPDSGEVLWVNDTACCRYMNIHMPSGSSFTGVAAQGYLVGLGDKLLVPTGRGLPGVFDRATGELIYYGNGPAFRAGGSWVMAFDRWFVCADKAYDLTTGMMRCADLGNLDRSFGTADKHGQRQHIPPGHMARELAVTPRWLLVATGDEVKIAKRSEPFADEPGAKPPVDNYLAPDQLAQLRGVTVTAAVRAPSEGGLIAAGDTAYVGGKGIVSAIDLNRRQVVWSAEVDGTAYGLAVAGGRLLVSTSEGMLYCFSATPQDEPKEVVERADRTPYPNEDRSIEQAAEEIIAKSEVTDGYCFDLGCGDGRLAYQLAKQSNLYVYAVDHDGQNVRKAREALFRAGLYGTRVMVDHVASLEATPAPDYFADLVVSGRSAGVGPEAAPQAEALRAARPYGGMVLRGRPGAMHKDVRGILEGAGRWSHQYADAANSLCSGDALVRSPLGVLWFGSPGQRGLPHGWGRPPAPLVVDGRMFIMGNDFIRCVDVYNGRVHWETPLEEVGKRYSSPHYAGTYLVGSMRVGPTGFPKRLIRVRSFGSMEEHSTAATATCFRSAERTFPGFSRPASPERLR